MLPTTYVMRHKNASNDLCNETRYREDNNKHCRLRPHQYGGSYAEPIDLTISPDQLKKKPLVSGAGKKNSSFKELEQGTKLS